MPPPARFGSGDLDLEQFPRLTFPLPFHDGGFLLDMKVSSPVPKKHARIEIIPLIDIMFFLLASFMMVSLSQTHMKGIRVNLPAAVGPPPSGVKDFVSIKVLEGNAVFFDNQYVADDQVLPRLYQYHRANPDIKISLAPPRWRCMAT